MTEKRTRENNYGMTHHADGEDEKICGSSSIWYIPFAIIFLPVGLMLDFTDWLRTKRKKTMNFTYLWNEERRMKRHNHLISEPCKKNCPVYNKRAKQGIIYPIIMASIMFFIILVMFFVFTPFLSGSLNFVGSFVNTLNNPSLTAFIFPYMQGWMLIWMGGIAALIITVLLYLGFSANRDEPIE